MYYTVVMSKKYILQLGLAFVLIYAGISAFIYPNDWIGYVPGWVEKFGTSQILALHLHSLVEILLGIWLISNWKVKLAGLITALDILAILIMGGFGRSVFLVTFRDVGLASMAIYLASN